MPIQQILDISPGHITSADDKRLRTTEFRSEAAALSIIRYHGGWMISTAGLLDGAADREERLAEFSKLGFSCHFADLMRHAADKGVVLVRLDRDADREPGLPFFDWENGDEPLPEEPAPGAR